tara:strand:- start:105 stop:374 length:270 start_codon:yes stop_codon:yes gene_type:complete
MKNKIKSNYTQFVRRSVGMGMHFTKAELQAAYVFHIYTDATESDALEAQAMINKKSYFYEQIENLKEEIKSLKRTINDYKVEITCYRNK